MSGAPIFGQLRNEMLDAPIFPPRGDGLAARANCTNCFAIGHHWPRMRANWHGVDHERKRA
jgi:hypothetical protein